jgi:DNA-binding IclR family transcriptional regulator
MQSRRSRRGLSTARAALQVAWLLAARPDGVRADQVAETLGKSVSTAYNLLASLCEEGVAAHHAGGVYRLAPAFRELVATGTPSPAPQLHDLAGLVGDLLAHTHKRSYLGVVRGGDLRMVLERGVQGMPKLPGLEPRIRDNAHALALGKVVLALAPDEVLARYVQNQGLRRFTARTITEPEVLRDELAAVRRRGFAVEREEFEEDFCSIAAPVRDQRRRFLGVIGISMTRRAFDDEHEALARTVVAVARTAGTKPAEVTSTHSSGALAALPFQASAETGPVLDPAAETRLACNSGSTLPRESRAPVRPRTRARPRAAKGGVGLEPSQHHKSP